MDKNELKREILLTMDLFKAGMQKIVEPLVLKEDVTLIQAFILFRIKEKRVSTIGDLYKEFDMNQGNVSSLCKKMEASGLIKRFRSEKDERVVFLNLTEKGEETIEKIYHNFDELEVYLKEFPKERLETIMNGLKEFNQLVMLISNSR